MTFGAQKILIRRGGLSGSWFAILRWHEEGSAVVADEKVDITDELLPLLNAAHRAGAEAALRTRASLLEELASLTSRDPL